MHITLYICSPHKTSPQTPHIFLAPRTSTVARHPNTALLPRFPVRHSHQAYKQSMRRRLAPPPLSNTTLLSYSTDRHSRKAHKQRIAFLLHGQGMVAGLSNTALLSHSTVRHSRQALKHRIAFMLPGQSIVAGLSNTALLSYSPDKHGHQALKHRIAPLLYDRARSPGTQTPHCFPALRTSTVARRTNKASGAGLRPRRSTVRHGRQALKHRIASTLHGQAWSPGTQTMHCFPTPRTRHSRQAHKQRIASPLHG